MRKFIVAVALAATSACTFVDSFTSGVASNLGSNAANKAVPRDPNASPAAYSAGGGGSSGGMSSAMLQNPAFLNMYMNVIFTYAFSSGGYDVAPVAYKPGQYTRWTGKAQNGKGIQLERAYLGDNDKGYQWWKVKWTDEENKTLILEGLLNPKENKFVRMRAKFPDDKEGQELALTESTYYHPPQKLSQDSVEGATKGVEKVTVPAGTFSAKHVVFGGMEGTHEWWLDNAIPGGTVRQLMKNPKNDEQAWDMQLAAYGANAQSELGSK